MDENKNIYKNFKEIIDLYKNDYKSYPIGKNEFDCTFGSIEFVKTKNPKKLYVHEIYVKEQYRNQGLCKEFIKCLIDKFPNKIIIIQSVLSKILYDFLLRFEYNRKHFILAGEGFMLVKS
jgi:hypothetical protein